MHSALYILLSLILQFRTTRAYIGSQPNDFGMAVIVAEEWVSQVTSAMTYPTHSAYYTLHPLHPNALRLLVREKPREKKCWIPQLLPMAASQISDHFDDRDRGQA